MNITTFEYNRNNQMTKETRPLGQATTYQYNAVGNLIRKIDAKNQKIEYEYDDAGRLITTKYFSASTDTTSLKTVTFAYSASGNLTGYNDGTTSASYTYDEGNRKLSESVNYGSFELTYAYDYYKNGLKKSLTMPDGTKYDYTYDANNQPSTISIPGQGVMTYNQYTWNAPAVITLPGGIRKENTYTPLMQPKTINIKNPAQNPLMTYDYTYSPTGNITAKNTEGGNYAYQYDPLYRLTNATNPSAPAEAYTYDPVGNRLTSADFNDWTYNNNNELTNYDGVAYEYDANGNTTKKTDSTGETIFTYDVENRLIQVRNPQSAIYNYYYDVFGRRLWKEVNGVRTYFFYSEEGLIGEYNSSGLEIKTYGYTPNSTWTTNPLFQKIGSTYYYYQNDHLGTPQNLTNSTGAVVWSATFDAFGKTTVQISIVENNFRFPGQYYDIETGLSYNWNRYYDAKTGRYLTTDPIGILGGVNLFSYAKNNSIKNIDIFGWFGDGETYGPDRTPGILGHSDFHCGNTRFDFTLEDHRWWSQPIGPGMIRHFRPIEPVEEDLRNDISRCDARSFESHMHQGQDYFSHIGAGIGPIEHIKLIKAGFNPDNNPEAWERADNWTCQMIVEWDTYCTCHRANMG